MTHVATRLVFDTWALGSLRYPPGETWLAGAYLGNFGSLGLHAVNASGQADTVLFEDLGCDAVRRPARTGATSVFPAKLGGLPSAKQLDVAERLSGVVRQEQRVQRLKGGNSLVCGRRGEATLGPVVADSSLRIITGATANFAGPADANLPAATRGTDHGVVPVAGQYAEGTERNPVWAKLVQSGLPVLVAAAISRNNEIADALMVGCLPHRCAHGHRLRGIDAMPPNLGGSYDPGGASGCTRDRVTVGHPDWRDGRASGASAFHHHCGG
jgi:uroporphyrin-III C-methyltransferase